jgi:hypothetical protein
MIKKWIVPSIIAFFILALTFIFIKYPPSKWQSLRHGPEVEIDWRLLADMDYVTGKAPSELKVLDGKQIRLPGFMVPLEDNMKKVTQFLLVPSPQACIHVPPPPPNQQLLIEMESGTEVIYGPIWIHGELNILPQRTQFGEASYRIKAHTVEAYQ